MLTLAMPLHQPHERASTATRSQQEELQQIEADLEQEKLHSLRSRLDSLLGSLATAAGNTTSHIEPTEAQPQQQQHQGDKEDSKARPLLIPGRTWVVDPYGDQGQYKGEVDEEGLPHGKGDMIYIDGRKYRGSWKHGHWHGNAKCRWPNGDVFRGTFHMCERHGQGSYQWNDGRSYVGDFVRDKRHGQGEFRWPDGSIYVGEFRLGHRDGYGNYRFPDGSVYEGSWYKSQMHGQGECKWADQRIYSGEWKNGKAHGLGKETRPDGSVRHEGLWEEDHPIRDATAVGVDTTTTTASPEAAALDGADIPDDIDDDDDEEMDESILEAVADV